MFDRISSPNISHLDRAEVFTRLGFWDPQKYLNIYNIYEHSKRSSWQAKTTDFSFSIRFRKKSLHDNVLTK